MFVRPCRNSLAIIFHTNKTKFRICSKLRLAFDLHGTRAIFILDRDLLVSLNSDASTDFFFSQKSPLIQFATTRVDYRGSLVNNETSVDVSHRERSSHYYSVSVFPPHDLLLYTCGFATRFPIEGFDQRGTFLQGVKECFLHISGRLMRVKTNSNP